VSSLLEKEGGLRPDVDCQFMQICFVVADLDQAMRHFSDLFKAGPWFLLQELPAHLDKTTYRGVSTPLGARIALSYAGDMMYELVCPRPESRSIFTEWVDKHGYGLHHFGFGVSDFDSTLRALDTLGLERLATTTTARGVRIVMVGGGEPLGAIEEYIELLPSNRAFYRFMKLEAANRDREKLIYEGKLPSLEETAKDR
jgi:Glyoxalase/Bleomycin resistance protein/Dioxygenase superfamily